MNPPKYTLIIAGIIVFVVLSVGSIALYNAIFGSGIAFQNEEEDCNVLGLNLHGTLYTYIPPESLSEQENYYGERNIIEDSTSSEEVVSILKEASKDFMIKGAFIEIDSFGGSPVAGEEIANALKNLGKPSVALIRQSGTSGAYWAATGADKIFASKNSDIGSIGVTASYVQNNDPEKEYVELSTGKYKDIGSPDKKITWEEKNLILRDLEIIKNNFIEAISVNRNLPIDDVKVLADGSSVLGEKAKELGLIDEIGSFDEAERYLEGEIGEKPAICWR